VSLDVYLYAASPSFVTTLGKLTVAAADQAAKGKEQSANPALCDAWIRIEEMLRSSLGLLGRFQSAGVTVDFDVDAFLSIDHMQPLYSANITHNLGRMAEEAGIYRALWHPEELRDPMKAARIHELQASERWNEIDAIRATLPMPRAHDLIAPLRAGLALMKGDPPRFRAFEPDNGWGTFRDFIPWIEDYLAACDAHPDARVEVSR
jgi:hypothetical protein